MTKDRLATQSMYCRKCRYPLVGLQTQKCPECGRAFEPNDPKTFVTSPRRLTRRSLEFILIPSAFIVCSGAAFYSEFRWKYFASLPHLPLVAGLAAAVIGLMAAVYGYYCLRSRYRRAFCMAALIWFGFWAWSVGKTIETTRILRQPINVEFEENRIDTIHTYLGEKLGVTFRADWHDLNSYGGFQPDDPITLHLEGESARTVLDLLAEPHHGPPVIYVVIHGDVVLLPDRQSGR